MLCPSVLLYVPHLSTCCWWCHVHQIKTRDELIIKPLTAQEAGDARDALAKALYSGETPDEHNTGGGSSELCFDQDLNSSLHARVI